MSLAEGSEAKASGTAAGTYNMGLTPADFTAASPNYESIAIEVVDGWLQINASDEEVVVSITENSATEVYDGSEKSVYGYTVTSISNELYNEIDFTFSGTAEAKGVAPGFYPMNIKAEDFVNKSANFSNVKFEIVDGGLTINPQSITPGPDPDDPDPSYDGITANSPEDVPYNGFDQSWLPTVTDADGKTLVKDVDYTVSYSTEDRTNVTGEIEVIITGIGNYTGTIDGLTYEVTPAPLTVVTDSAAKVFDGTALTAAGEVTGFVNGETAAFATTGTITQPGQVDNTYAIDWESEATTALESNYSIASETIGKLTVYPQSIDPEDPDPENPDPNDPTPDDPDPENPDQPFYSGVQVEGPGDVTYNGLSQQQAPVVTDREGNALDPNYYDVAYSEDTVNVGTVTITVTGKNGYTGTVEVAYQILKAPLTISTPSAGKVYDGTPLQNQQVSAGVWQDNDGSQVALTATGSITEVGSVVNGYTVSDPDGVLANYEITENLGVLTVWPQSIDPNDPGDEPDPDNPDAPDPSVPDPDFPGQDPDPDNPVVPDQPFYTGAVVDSPVDVVYNGADQTWVPTVTDAEGRVLTEGVDYTVAYSTEDRTNVTGQITVTITGMGDYAGTVTRTYQVTPLAIDVYIENQSKEAGQADPTFTFNYEGVLEGESMAWTGEFVRTVGEAVGSYEVSQGSFALADNAEGGFLAGNYTLTVHPGTLTITTATTPDTSDTPDTPDTPVTPDTPTPLPTPDPGTPTPVPTPAPGDEGATPVEDTTDEAEEAIDDEATPRTAPEPIDDDGTPLASGAHRDCWVHWLMLLGILATVVYYGGVGVRRVRFSSSLQSFEDDVLGNDEINR